MEQAIFQKKVVIIGAGMAGLSAAEHLVKNGWNDIVVLEAQDRIGGRIHTVPFGSCTDSIVEFGANWIHGEALNNPVMTLACELDLVNEWTSLNRIDGFCYTSAGEAIEQELTSQIWHLFQKWEAETTVTQESSGDHIPDINMEDFLQKRFDELLKVFPKQNHFHMKCIFNCLLNYERFHQGTALTTTPAFTDAGLDCDVPGKNIKVKAGMSKLVHSLAHILNSNQLKLNREVISINHDGDKVLVSCSQGDMYVADHVVVTVSLGVLKQTHKMLFQPALPKQKQDAMESIAFGKVNKIFLKWERPFWKVGIGSIKLGWSDAEKEVIHPSEWYKRIFAFDEVLNNRNVLVAWISGDEAEHVEGISEYEIIDVCTDLLRMFLGNPGIPKPVKAVCSGWCKNQYTRGSYSNVDYKTTRSTFQDLAAPVYDLSGVQRLLFAGEATINNGYSTMNGARRSGLREAQSLLSLYSGAQYRSKL